MDLQGTNVAAGIVPFTDQDGYATHQAKYGKGGLRTAANRAERLALPKDRRELYMEVTDAGIKWRLNSGLDSEVTTDADWDTAPGSGDMQKAEYAPSKIPGAVDYALEIASETQNRIIYVDQVNGKDDDPAYDGSSWEKAFKTGSRMLRSIKRNCPVQISALFSEGDHDWSGLTSPLIWSFGTTGGINMLGVMELYKYVTNTEAGSDEENRFYYTFTEINSSGAVVAPLNLPKNSLKFFYSINGGHLSTNHANKNPRANGCCVGSRITTNDVSKITPAEMTGQNGMRNIMLSKTTFKNFDPSFLYSENPVGITKSWHVDVFIKGLAVIDCNIEVPNKYTKTGVPGSETFQHFAFQHLSLENCHLYAKEVQEGDTDVYSYPISFTNCYVHGCSLFRDNYNTSYPYAIWVGNVNPTLFKLLSIHLEGNFIIGIYGGTSPSTLLNAARLTSELIGNQLSIIRTVTPLKVSETSQYLHGIAAFSGNFTKMMYRDVYVQNMAYFGLSVTGGSFIPFKLKLRKLFVVLIKPESNVPAIAANAPNFYVASYSYSNTPSYIEESYGNYNIDFDFTIDMIYGLTNESSIIYISETSNSLGRLLRSAKLNMQSQLYYNTVNTSNTHTSNGFRVPLICGFSYNQIALTTGQEISIPLLCAAEHKGITGEVITSDMKIAGFTFLLNRLSLTDRTYSFITDGTTEAELEITLVLPATGTEVLVWKFYEVKIKNTGSVTRQITLHTEVIPVTPNTP